MIGLCSDCPEESTDCIECLNFCDFLAKIKEKYSATGGVYTGATTYLHPLIESMVEGIYEVYKETCDTTQDVTSLGRSLLSDCVPSMIEECVVVCNTEYTCYMADPCGKCEPIEYTFNDEFYHNVIKAWSKPRTQSREFYNELGTIFGWRFIYTTDFIYVVLADPLEYYALSNLIPTPFGETIVPITLGC